MAKGKLGSVGWPILLGSTTQSLTPYDLSSIAAGEDSIQVTIMPVKITYRETGFKKYYFIKQAPITKTVKIKN